MNNPIQKNLENEMKSFKKWADGVSVTYEYSTYWQEITSVKM